MAVLSAEGRHFTAGVELDQWAGIFSSGEGFPVREGEVDPLGTAGDLHRKPVVIAVQGYCFTWGVEALLNTEIRVAASDTQFQMLEVQRGLYPCGGATMRLPREIGWGNAQRVLLIGSEKLSVLLDVDDASGVCTLELTKAFVQRTHKAVTESGQSSHRRGGSGLQRLPGAGPPQPGDAGPGRLRRWLRDRPAACREHLVLAGAGAGP